MTLVTNKQVYKTQKTFIMAIFNDFFRFLLFYRIFFVALYKQLILSIALFDTSEVECKHHRH